MVLICVILHIMKRLIKHMMEITSPDYTEILEILFFFNQLKRILLRMQRGTIKNYTGGPGIQ